MKHAVLLAWFFIGGVTLAADDATQVAHTSHFDLHSDPWLNLHHFLYQWSRADEGIAEGRQPVTVTERDALPPLSAADRETWNAALSFYRANIARLSHFNDDMLSQKFSLLVLAGDTSAVPEEDIEGIGTALQAAMPVYLEYWWPAHDARNRQWVEAILDDLLRSEASFVSLIERIYSAEWPDEARRVDISAYANFAAGYTALGHVVIFSSDPGNQGLYGMETLYHEVQHTREIRRPAISRMEAVFTDGEPAFPDNFWHSMIFATAGAFVGDHAERRGRGPHLPYWEREGFGELRGWKDAYRLVNEYWLPVVAGDSTTEAAMLGIAQDLSSPE